MFELKSKAVIFPLPVLVLVAVALLAAPGTAKPNEKQISLRTTLLETEFLREDISNPEVKSAYVKKFEVAKKEHSRRIRHDKKKSRSHQKLSSKGKHGDELTGSGHKASLAPEDEAAKFMTMLPWVLPIVCITILVLVGVGAKMCQAGNYKHTAALKESGVQPTFKYGGPIGAGPM